MNLDQLELAAFPLAYQLKMKHHQIPLDQPAIIYSWHAQVLLKQQ